MNEQNIPPRAPSFTQPSGSDYVEQFGGAHYQGQWQHWDWVPLVPAMGWCEANVTKYGVRAFKKNGVADLKKAVTYIRKMRVQFLDGLLQLPTLPEIVRRNNLYQEWLQAQDFGALTKDATDDLFDLMLEFGRWPEESSRSKVRGEEEFSRLVRLFESFIHKYFPEVERPEEVQSTDPVAENPPAVETRAYQNQSAEPVPVADAPSEFSVINASAALRHASLYNNKSPRFPVSAFSKALEDLRRWTKEVKLDLTPRGDTMSAYADYAEALLKIDLGLTHLEESIPNRQSARSFVALMALEDGLSCLSVWFSCLTEGEKPVVQDEALRSQLRLISLSSRALVAAHTGRLLQAEALTTYNAFPFDKGES